MKKKRRLLYKSPLKQGIKKKRIAIKKARHRIFHTEELPAVWVVCQSVKRKTKKGKFDFFQKRVGLPVCIIRSQQLHPLYEDCYGCTKWHDYVLVKGGNYVKRRQKIEKATKKKTPTRRKIS